ncbi:MAG TPA: trypsin-like peptidase domain-containing protein [Cyclobacteriaceae bacterium]|jgi:Do/DeqQ family serine protease|nr:trypsin-like peptidase domain-containing protein [Cyclobacteriaceae bacterium]
MKRSFLIPLVILAAFVGALLGILFTVRYLNLLDITYSSIDTRQQRQLARYGNDSIRRNSFVPNFEDAARAVTPGVVHISTIYGRGNFSLNPLELYFRPQAHSSGSGVIISDDGFIVTNNHVIEDASSIEVVMNNNQRFYAKLIGRDQSTDLALLKIKANNLPFVPYGNSDAITPGEWVLAIGNPFDLNSTVTAGIVSAKARNIGILRDRNNLQVESFIQTDAAVNPGNSGGALVNLKGELIGINSAIATSTGNYNGYSFAIPVSLVKKIMDDLLEFGQVQRGLLGVQIRDVTAELAEDNKLDVVQGVYIDRVNQGSAAEESGLTSGDVITAINNHHVTTVSELQEWVARNRPGQSVNVMFRRSGETKNVKTVLKNYDGTDEMRKKEVDYTLEGATLEDVPYNELTRLRLDGGVTLKSIREGNWKNAGIREGFIITYVDKVPVDNVDDLNRILELKHGGVLVEGVYQNGKRKAYALMW